ncbi:MAG: thioredoxin-like domain-containing protein [Agriterribacter sp.]
MMKKIGMIMAVVLITSGAFAQTLKNNGKVAPFVITLDSGKTYTHEDLKKEPLMLIYFSPECDHCRNFTKDMMKNIKSFTDKQIVMVTFLSLEEIKKFVTDFDLASHHNIKVGTEANTFLVRNYYNVEHFPFVVLYDKNGKEIKTFANRPSIKEIIKASR